MNFLNPIKVFHKNQRLLKQSFHTNGIRENFLKSLFKVDAYEPPYDHVIQIGDPTLRKVSDPVPVDLIQSDEIKFLIKKMRKVMKSYDLVGIASPQIGINLRVIIMEFDKKLKEKFTENVWKTKEMEILPHTVIINPEIQILDHNQKVFEESCGSIRGYCGEVARYQKLSVAGYDENAQQIELVLNGWNARIVQHEMDHLNGVLFTDLMDRKSFKCTSWEVVNAKQGRVVIPFSPKK